MKGFFVGGGNRHTHNIKQNANHNDDQQDHKRGCNTGSGHDLIGQETNGSGNQNRDQKNGKCPFPCLPLFPFGTVRFGFCHRNSPYFRNKSGGRRDKSYGLGRVGFPREEPAVAEQAVSI